MEKSLALVLNFVNNATPGLEAAAASAKEAMSSMSTQSTQAGNSMSSVWENTGGRVVSAIGKIVEQSKLASLIIGGSLVKGITDAVNMAGEFERFGKAAEYLTGSSKAADQFAASVRHIANDTIFNIDQIAKMDNYLVGNTKNVQQSDAALRALADGVAATGGGYSELEGATRAWIQTNSKAKASSEELNRQFSNANIPMLRVLAQHIVSDANSPLREYIATAGDGGGATGVSKKLATAYSTASDKIGILGEKLKLAQLKQDDYTKSSKKSEVGELTKKIAVESAQKAYDSASGTITKFNNANKQTVVHGTAAKLTIKDVMAQLQSIGNLNIPGTVMASEITKALNEAYGGANKNLINTFSGQMSLLGDVFKQVALSVLGIDQNFRPVQGGIINLLTNALRPMVNFLQTHQEDIQKWAAEWSKSTPILYAVVTAILGAVLPAILFIVGPILLLATVFGSLGYFIGVVVEKLGGFAHIVQTVQGVLAAIQPYWPYIEGALIGIAIVVGAMLIPYLYGLAAAAWAAAAPLLVIEASFIAAAAPIIGMIALVVLVGAAIGVLAALVIMHWSTIQQWTQQVWGGIVTFFTVTIPQAFTVMMTAVGIWVAGVIAWFAALPPAVMAWVTDLFVTKIPFAIGFMIGWITVQLPMMLVMMVMWFVDTGTRVINEVATWPGRFINWLANLIDTAIIYIIAFEVNFVNWFMQIGTNSVSEVSTWPARIMNFLNKLPGQVATFLGNLLTSFVNGLDSIWNKITGWKDQVVNAFNSVANAISHALDLAGKALSKGFVAGAGFGGNFANGGIVNAPVGQPVPIIAHGGEKVVPLGGTDVNGGGSGGGSTVNFYGNVNVDSDERVRQLAQQISQILGRQSELARYGAGY